MEGREKQLKQEALKQGALKQEDFKHEFKPDMARMAQMSMSGYPKLPPNMHPSTFDMMRTPQGGKLQGAF